MLTVSRKFIEAMKAAKRNIVGKIQIDWTDPFLDQSIQVSANEEARISWKNQIADAIEDVPRKWASLDGSWVLDGTWRLAPDTEEDAENYQMGWWGETLASYNGDLNKNIKSGNVYAGADDITKISSDISTLDLDTVTLPIKINIPDANSSSITIGSTSKSNAISYITQLQSDDIKIILEPFPWINSGTVGETSYDPTDADAFFANWQSMLDTLIDDIAEEYELWALNVASNFVNLESYESEWINLIRHVRKKYNGKVIYRTNWWVTATWDTGPESTTEAYQQKLANEIFGVVDIISISCYFELTETDVPAVSELTTCINDGTTKYSRGQKIYDEIKAFHDTWDKPIIFGELGCPAEELGASEPWNESPSGIASQAVQNNYIEAFLDVFANEDWFYGASIFVIGLNVSSNYDVIGNTAETMISDYTIEDYPTLTMTFASRPVQDLEVVGDSARQEYPVDFDVKLYDGDDTLLHEENITANDVVKWEKEITNVNSVEKIELIVYKWSHVGRQVKIIEFFTSIQETYLTDDIFLINLLEEREISQGSLPIGNISSNEIDIRVYNENRKFDAGNIESSLYQLVKTNRRIKAWLGVEIDGEIEYVPLGTFWSGDWDVPENELYAGTSARDRLELLRTTTYSDSQVHQDRSLYQIAIDILTDAGVDSEDYFVDTELQSKIVPWSYFESKVHRAALKDVAIAAIGQLYVDRNNVIRLEGPSYIENTVVNEQHFLQSQFPAEIESIEAYGIGKDDYFSKSQPTKSAEMANYVIVDTEPLQPATTAEEVYRSNDTESIDAGEIKTTTVFFNSKPVIEASVSLEDNTVDTTITDVTYYAWGANIEITNAGASSDDYTIVVDGKPLTVQNKERKYAKDDDSINNNGKITYKFPGNHLVQTVNMAQDIADSLLASYKDPRNDTKLDWRGNPALTLADPIVVPEYQRNNIDKRAIFYITRQNFEYDGGLRVNTEGRKI